MSHPGVQIDPATAAAEFATVADVLGVAPQAVTGPGADPATALALVALGAAAIADATMATAATADQSAAAAAGQRTVGGYVTTEGQNEQALYRPELLRSRGVGRC